MLHRSVENDQKKCVHVDFFKSMENFVMTLTIF
jgi:hypothetical protein